MTTDSAPPAVIEVVISEENKNQNLLLIDKDIQMAKERKDIPATDCWNVASLYPTFEAWEQDFQRWQQKDGTAHFSELVSYKGSLGKSPARLAAYLKENLNVSRSLAKLHTYAHLRHDEDVGEDQAKQANARAQKLYSDFKEATSWDEPELLSLSEDVLQTFIKSDELKDYRIYLERMLRAKPHVLSSEMEELLAKSAMALGTSYKGFTAFSNGDLKFPDVVDSQGNRHELTQGMYSVYLKNKDRTLREATFKTLHNGFLAYENTLCELLQGQIQSHFFETRARRFSSCLEASLFPHQIEPDVYKNLIKSIRAKLPSLHRYIELRKQIMGIEEMHAWDLSVPLVEAVDFSIDFDGAVEKILASVTPLGPDYKQALEKGLKQDRWVDRYENNRKRSGAYSSGCYDSVPFILMNFQGTFRDMMTLTHEAGHSMQSLLSNRSQPYQYASYPIFVAEVASTFNEELLLRHLMRTSQSPKEKAYLINQKIEDIRSTLFRQVMFAEFELKIHEWVEKGVPLTPSLLKNEYRQLCQDYFGPHFVLDKELDIEWARIPHFYYNFYVYQYATGLSAALALVERFEKEGEKARQDYMRFLSAGGSKFPLDLLSDAGVDMRKSDAIFATIDYFDRLVNELVVLLKK